MDIFGAVDKFLNSITNYLTYGDIFLIFVGLFLVTTIIVLISTAKSYEIRLVKAMDMFNNYFVDNPQITEENLVPFNQRMKSKKVPKQLRKQWQQFVLYREHNASYYMSFENCVSNPLKNSSFKRDLTILNILAYFFAIVSLVLNLYFSFETDNLSALLQHCLLGPALILLINFIVTIFLEVRNNVVVSDLYQNFQYFETNIDKATKTLPDYVDYEVLFDRAEIKKGIPILYAYLQKRAEEEQRELEMARLKNVEHEQFNFEEAGLAGSLVLERAMQEAENYIAERKKFNQDTEQINTDITQEEMNYREITKEYNRQMQVSRETFENFKSQLTDVSSTIEANYLKKQQQQELDRQRNLERDFDTHTERHKKVLESYQAELDSVDKFREQSRKALEDAMMSEFKTYSIKVFEEAKKQAEELQEEKFNKIKEQVKELEEKLVAQGKELENAYATNQTLSEQLSEQGLSTDVNQYETKAVLPQEPATPIEEKELENIPVEEIKPEAVEPKPEIVEPVEEVASPTEPIEEIEEEENLPAEQENLMAEPENEEQTDLDSIEDVDEEDLEETEEDDVDNQEMVEIKDELDKILGLFNKKDSSEDFNKPTDDENDEDVSDDELAKFFDNETDDEEPLEIKPEIKNDSLSNISTEEMEESEDVDEGEIVEQSKKRPGRPRKVVTEDVVKQPKKRGRPRKEKVESTEPKRKPGRPKKVEVEEITTEPKRGRGRPKKVTTDVVTEKEQPKRKAGRPKKTVVKVEAPKKKAGRPKKVQESVNTTPAKKKVGRPKKQNAEKVKSLTKKGRGRPKKSETKEANVVRKAGRPKKVEAKVEIAKKKAGRPKKNVQPKNTVDIDAYIKELDKEIAKENAKYQATKKQLDKKANLSKSKK